MFKKKRQHKMSPKKDIFNPPKSFHEEKKNVLSSINFRR